MAVWLLLLFLFSVFFLNMPEAEAQPQCINKTIDLQDIGLFSFYLASDTLQGFNHTVNGLNDGNTSQSSGNEQTGWHSTSGTSSHWIQVSFPYTPLRITSYRITSRTGYAPYPSSPTSFSGSFDGANFTVLDSFSNPTNSWVNRTVPSPYSSVGYRTFRWNLTSLTNSRGYVDIAEIELYGCYYSTNISAANVPAGHYVPSENAASRLCEAGYACLYGVRYQCPYDMYSPYNGSTNCTSIPDGYLADSSGSGLVPCIPGSYCVNGTSTLCSAGTYSDISGQSKCKLVPDGYLSNAYNQTGGTSIDPCPVLSYCYSGFKYSCPNNTLVGASNCSTSPVGTYAGGTRNCSAGSYCEAGLPHLCPPGTFSPQPLASQCQQCPAETYASSGKSNCTFWTVVCSNDQYEVTPPSISSDRVCANITRACRVEQYIAAASTPTSDLLCLNCSVCSKTQYIEANCSQNSDTKCASMECGQYSFFQKTPNPVCVSCPACPSNSYLLGCTSPSNLTCVPCTNCSTYETAVAACSYSSDTLCLPRCNYTYQYFSTQTCTNATLCKLDQYQSIPLTYTSNRVCMNLLTCSKNQFQKVPPTPTSNRVCSPITNCTALEYIVRNATATSDRGCKGLSSCNLTTQYISTPPTLYSDLNCSSLSTCKFSEYVSTPSTPTSDVVCRAHTLCFFENLQYVAVEATPTTNRICGNFTWCPAGQFVLTFPYVSISKICMNLTQCAGSQFESFPASVSNDRACDALTVCRPDQYQALPSTASSDRTCRNASVCSFSSQYISSVRTATSDTVCSALSVCTAGSFEDIKATNFSNRHCTPCSLGMTDADSSPSTPCVLCDAGAFLPVASSGPCSSFACLPGFSDSDKSSATPCVSCPVGSYGAGGTSPCVPCSGGSVDQDSSPSTPCVLCGAGSYVPSGRFGLCSSFQCAAGSADLDSNSSTPCEACLLGTYAPRGSSLCVACVEGYIDDDYRPDTPCTPCPAGGYVAPGKSGPCSAFLCAPGSADIDQNAATPCVPCVEGSTYQPQAGQLMCLPVTPSCNGSLTENFPPTLTTDRYCSKDVRYCSLFNSQDRSRCIVCQDGYTLFRGAQSDTCLPCQKGSFCIDNVVTLCPAGTFTEDGGRANCTLCEVGSSTNGLNGQSACYPCPSRYYAPRSGMANCTLIPSGMYGGLPTVEGGGYRAALSCPAGSFCINGEAVLCGLGYFSSAQNSTTCTECGLGRYNPRAGLSFECSPIPEGYYGIGASTTTNFETSGCPAGSYCAEGVLRPCPKGTYTEELLATSCKPCGAGFYNPVPGRNSSCDTIPVGMYAVDGGPTFISVSSILSCPAGSFCVGGLKEPCGYGFYQPAKNKTSCLPCSDLCGQDLTFSGCDPVSGIHQCLDTMAPVIALTGANPMVVQAGTKFSDPGATSSDNIGVVSFSSNATSVDTGKLGTVKIIYKALDAAGLSGVALRTVQVVDSLPPSIVVLDSPVYLFSGDIYTGTAISTTDSFDPPGKVKCSSVPDPTSLALSLGSHTILYTCKDSSNNSALASQTIIVLDNATESAALSAALKVYTAALDSNKADVSAAEQQAFNKYQALNGQLPFKQFNNLTTEAYKQVSNPNPGSEASSSSSSNSGMLIGVAVAVGLLVMIALLVLLLWYRTKRARNENRRRPPQMLLLSGGSDRSKGDSWVSDGSLLTFPAVPMTSNPLYGSSSSGPLQQTIDGVPLAANPIYAGSNSELSFPPSPTRPQVQNFVVADSSSKKERYFDRETEPYSVPLTQNPVYGAQTLADKPAKGGRSSSLDSHIHPNPLFDPSPSSDYARLNHSVPKQIFDDVPEESTDDFGFGFSDAQYDRLGSAVHPPKPLPDQEPSYAHLGPHKVSSQIPDFFSSSNDYDSLKVGHDANLTYDRLNSDPQGPVSSNYDHLSPPRPISRDEDASAIRAFVERMRPHWLRESLSRSECESLLKDAPVGTFIIRESSQKGSYALSIKKNSTGEIWTGLILHDQRGYRLQNSSKFAGFTTVDDLVTHYYESENNPDLPVPLLFPSSSSSSKPTLG